MIEGYVEKYVRDEKGDFTKFVGKSPNLWVDDSKEFALDFMFGNQNWMGTYHSNRYMGFGACMFHNSSFERASGINGVASGSEYDYPVADTYLVSPEDSFLSNEVGSRVLVDVTRRDQSVEISATVLVPGNIDIGTYVREFSMFLQSSGPSHDPSYHEASKPNCMLARSSLFGTGYYDVSGIADKGDPGAKLCYYDDPYYMVEDVKLRWVFGEQ